MLICPFTPGSANVRLSCRLLDAMCTFYQTKMIIVYFGLIIMRHSRLTHRYLLLAEVEPTCPHCFCSTLTIRHLLTDCLGLRYLYRQYFQSSSPCLTYLIGEKPHHELFNFLKDASFYHEI